MNIDIWVITFEKFVAAPANPLEGTKPSKERKTLEQAFAVHAHMAVDQVVRLAELTFKKDPDLKTVGVRKNANVKMLSPPGDSDAT